MLIDVSFEIEFLLENVRGLSVEAQPPKSQFRKSSKKSSKVVAAWTSDGRVIALVPASNGSEIKRRIRSEEDLRTL